MPQKHANRTIQKLIGSWQILTKNVKLILEIHGYGIFYDIASI